MMKRLLLLLLLAAPVLAQAPAERFDQLVEDYGRLGELSKRADQGDWPLAGAPAAAELRTDLRALVTRADSIDEGALDDGRWIDLEILRAMAGYRIEELGWRLADPSFPLPDGEAAAQALGEGEEGTLVELYARLKCLPVRILERQAELSPADRGSVEAALERIDGVRKLLAESGPAAEARLGSFGNAPSDARAGADLALELYRRHLAERLLPAAEPAGPGIGRKRFIARLRLYHLVEDPPEEIVAAAERVFAETEGLLEETARGIDRNRSWREIAEEMKGAGPEEDELVEYCRATMEESVAFLREKKIVPLPEFATNCGVKGHATKGFYPYAYYEPARGRDLRGEYVVTTVGDWMSEAERLQKTRDSNRYWMRVVTVHESFPGHHLQFALAAKARTSIRGQYYTPFFSEGWGLYSEDLMWRHGFLSDPRTRIAQLRMRLWRAARVLCDVGLHTRTMTPGDAVRLLVERCLLEPDSAKKEVNRYLGSPTQPMSYLVGYLAIERMRDEYQRLHGDRPDWELEFHTRLLSYGPVPPSLLERVVLGTR